MEGSLTRLLTLLMLQAVVWGCAALGRPTESPTQVPPAQTPDPVLQAPPPKAADPAPTQAQHPEEKQRSYRIALYRPDQLAGGNSQPAREWQVVAESVTGFTLAPDGETALLYPGDPMIGGPSPYLLHLATGKETPLPLPKDDQWSAFGGWLPDGRLILVGRQLWVGGPGVSI